MRANGMCTKVCVVVLASCVGLAQLPALAQEKPGDDALERLREKLTSAQWKIVGGDLQNGLKQVSEVKRAAPQLASVVQFAEKLAEAVTAEKAGDFEKAERVLKVTAAMADESEQFDVVLVVGLRLVRRHLGNQQKARAINLVTFLASGKVKEVKAYGPHSRLAGLQLAVGDLEKAEAELVKAAGFAKTRHTWDAWSWGALALFNECTKSGQGAAVYGRLSPLLSSKEAKLVVVGRFLDAARRRLATGGDADVILKAVRADAAAIPELAPSLQIIGLMVAARAKAAAGDHDGALTSMQEAYKSVQGNPVEALNVYRLAVSLVRGLIRSGEAPAALKVVAFLKAGPGREVDPLTRHMDLAGFDLALGEFAEAEVELRKTAPLCKTDSDWRRWASMVWTLARHREGAAAMLAVFDAMAPLATSKEGKTRLAEGFLGGTCGYLSRGDVARGRAILKAVAKEAAQWPELTAKVNLLKKMESVHTSWEASDHAGAVEALKAASELAKDDRVESREVYYLGRRLLLNLISAKDGPAALKVVAFLKTGARQGIDPLTLHMDLAGFELSLGKLTEAEEEVRQAAPLCKTDSDWRRWASMVWATADHRKDAAAALAVFDAMASLATSKEGKSRLLGSFLVGARPYLAGRDVAKGTAIVNTLGGLVANLPELTTELNLLRRMAAVHAASEAADLDGAINALRAASDLVRDKRAESADVYTLGTGLVRGCLAAKDPEGARTIIALLSEGPARHVDARSRLVDTVQFDLALGDIDKAEEDLTKLASVLDAAGGRWEAWSYQALSVVIQRESPQEAAASAKRLASQAKGEAAKEVVLGRFLSHARYGLAGEAVEKGAALVGALKDVAARVTELKPTAAVLEKMVSARRFSEKDDHASALEALQEAQKLAKGRPQESKDLYTLGKALTTRCLKAKEESVAKDFVKFLREGPGEAVPSFTVHADLARFHITLRGFTEAEEEVRQAARFAKTQAEWDRWAGLAWDTASRLQRTRAIISAYTRMKAMATSPDANESLVERFLTGARGYLCSRDVPKGRTVFDAVKTDAPGLPGLTGLVEQLEHMDSAHRLSDKGDHVAALEKLRETHRLAQGDRLAVYEVQMAATRLFRNARVRGDYAAAQAIIDFMDTGPGSEQDAPDVHGRSARLLATAKKFAEAEEELRKAAPFGRGETEWREWADDVSYVIDRAESLGTGLAVCSNLTPVAKSDAAKNALALVKTRLVVKLGEPANAEELVRQLKGIPTDLVSLRYRLAGRYFERARSNDAYRVFKQAEVLAETLSDAMREKLLREAFYYRTRVRYGLPTLLAREVRDGKAQGVPDRVLSSYVEAAAAGGNGEKALGVLEDIEAKPRYKLFLAKHLRNYGDVTRARRALASIPRSALGKDGELARAVRGFWPARADRVQAEIDRCLGLIKVYEDRARTARAKGKPALAERCEKQIAILRQKIDALEKEAGQ